MLHPLAWFFCQHHYNFVTKKGPRKTEHKKGNLSYNVMGKITDDIMFVRSRVAGKDTQSSDDEPK